MKQITNLRIGGVPEHFNLPWHLAIDSGVLRDNGLKASWLDFPGGTGSMVAALNDGEVDVAMLLTEGALKGLEQGGDYEIISFYTDSPLIWGIHVPAHSKIQSLGDCKNKPVFAISRYGSGSHLMAYLLADTQGWSTDDLEFELIGDLEGARELFKQGGDYLFLWEKFMTQPQVDRGEFRRVGDFPTPWPCFVVCVRKSILSKYKSMLFKLIDIVQTTAIELSNSPIAAKLIASRYGLQISQVEKWLEVTQWSRNSELDTSVITKVKHTLRTLNLL